MKIETRMTLVAKIPLSEKVKNALKEMEDKLYAICPHIYVDHFQIKEISDEMEHNVAPAKEMLTAIAKKKKINLYGAPDIHYSYNRFTQDFEYIVYGSD